MNPKLQKIEEEFKKKFCNKNGNVVAEDQEEVIIFLRTQIEELLKEEREELIPEEIKKDYTKRKNVLAECSWDSGWNACREEIKNLIQLRK